MLPRIEKFLPMGHLVMFCRDPGPICGYLRCFEHRGLISCQYWFPQPRSKVPVVALQLRKWLLSWKQWLLPELASFHSGRPDRPALTPFRDHYANHVLRYTLSKQPFICRCHLTICFDSLRTEARFTIYPSRLLGDARTKIKGEADWRRPPLP
jgi:hypothetical protein